METIIEGTDAERVEDYEGRLADAFGRLDAVLWEVKALSDEGVPLACDVGDAELSARVSELDYHVMFAYDALRLAWNLWDSFLPC